MENDQRYTMRDVKFNTCGEGDTSWYVQAAELNADTTRRPTITAKTPKA